MTSRRVRLLLNKRQSNVPYHRLNTPFSALANPAEPQKGTQVPIQSGRLVLIGRKYEKFRFERTRPRQNPFQASGTPKKEAKPPESSLATPVGAGPALR